jgi:prephenate dehydrogenase
MQDWDTVAIIGVGLIGGSIGLALQQRDLARRVVGIGRRQRIDRGVADADLVIVCTPVGDIVDHVCQAAQHCPAACLLTDAGSTKGGLVRELDRRLGPGPSFVGSHPMAGSEKTGPENARADLFDGQVAVVTPTASTNPGAVERVEHSWSSLGARVIRMAPQIHDEAVAMTSHATHVVASALAAATAESSLALAASGWRDTTRVAAGDPQLWRQILLANRQQVVKSLKTIERTLAAFRIALAREDAAGLVELLDRGKKTRDSLGS